MKQLTLLLLLLLSTSCVKQAPRPDPPPDPAPVVTPTPSPSRLPVEPGRRRLTPPKHHHFQQGETVKLAAKDGGDVWVYRDAQALEANDTAKAFKAEPGSYAEILRAYSWSGDLEVKVATGSHDLRIGSVRRSDCLWLDGKRWRR